MASTNVTTKIGQFRQPSTTAVFDAVSANAVYIGGVLVTTGGGTVTSVSGKNIGGGVGIYAINESGTGIFRSISGAGVVTVTQSGSGIEINSAGGAGEANTISNTGTGVGVYRQKVGVNLELKSLSSGYGIGITDLTTSVSISATSQTAQLATQVSSLWNAKVPYTGATANLNMTSYSLTGASLSTLTIFFGDGTSQVTAAGSFTGGAVISAYWSTMRNGGTAVGGAATIPWLTSNVQLLAVTSTTTLTFDGMSAGGRYLLILSQGSTTGGVVWPSYIKWVNGQPNISSTAAATDLISFVYDGVSAHGSWNSSQTASTSIGEVNTASNTGAGTGVYRQKTGVNLEFKSLSAGDNIGITDETLVVTISGQPASIPRSASAYNVFFVHPSFTGTNTAFNYYNSISGANAAYVTGATGCIFVYSHPSTGYQEIFTLKEGVKMMGLGSHKVKIVGSVSTTNFHTTYQYIDIDNISFEALSGYHAFSLGSGDSSSSVSSIARFHRCKFDGSTLSSNFNAFNHVPQGTVASVDSLIIGTNGGYTTLGGGIFRSIDGGETWVSPLTGALGSSGALSAATVYTLEWGVLSAGMSSPSLFFGRGSVNNGPLMYRSSDSGNTWIDVTKNTPLNPTLSGMTGYTANRIFKSPTDVGATSLYVATARTLYRTNDNGANWCALPQYNYSYYNGGWSPQCDDGVAVVSGSSKLTLLVANVNYGLDRSPNDGGAWVRAQILPGSTNANCLLASGSDLFCGTTTKGVWKSTNQGITWTSSSAGMGTGAVSISCIILSGSVLYATQKTVANKVFKSTDGGANWTTITGGLSASTIPSGTRNDIFAFNGALWLGTTQYGPWKSTDEGATWVQKASGLGGSGPLNVNAFAGYTSQGTFPTFAHELYFEDCEFIAPVGDTTRAGLSLSALGRVTNFSECAFQGQQFLYPRTAGQNVVFDDCEFQNGDIAGYDSGGAYFDYRNCYFNGGRISTLAGSNVTWHRVFNSVIKSGNFYSGAGARVEVFDSTLIGSAANSSIFSIDNAAKVLKLIDCKVLSGYGIVSAGVNPTMTFLNTVWKNGGGVSISGNCTPLLGNFTSESAFGSGVTASSSSFNVNILTGVQL